MAWTAPMTAVANATFLAAEFNTHVRDNLNETAPAKATTAGRIFVSTGVNAIAERAIESAEVQTLQTTTSTSYTNLTTVGPAVTLTTGTSALIFYSAQAENSSAGSSSNTDYEVSGASSRSPSDTTAVSKESSTAGEQGRRGVADIVTSLTAGVNTFTLKYRVDGGTGSFSRRRLVVIAL